MKQWIEALANSHVDQDDGSIKIAVMMAKHYLEAGTTSHEDYVELLLDIDLLWRLERVQLDNERVKRG